MIAYVRGKVAAITLNSTVVEVGGVGFQVMCSPGTLATLREGHEATVPTSMVVREDSLTLFGFVDDDEKACFELVQTASGVGPKLAQAILSVLSPDDLRRAITSDDVKALTKVTGVGQKGAQRIILELRDRIGAPQGATTTQPGRVAQAPWRDQVVQGLVGLGWSAKEAERATDAVSEDAEDTPDVGAVLRAALQHLSRG